MKKKLFLMFLFCLLALLIAPEPANDLVAEVVWYFRTSLEVAIVIVVVTLLPPLYLRSRRMKKRNNPPSD